jgi:uracil-DNA glycosylase
MESEMEFHAALAALAWQVDLGADEAVGEAPVDRYEAAVAVAVAAPAVVAAAAPAPVASPAAHAATALADAVAEAQALAAGAQGLDALREALAGYERCELKRGAKSLVFADGNPQARVLVLGEAPGRDEDIEGRPFVGRAGQLLDRMFAAIGLRAARTMRRARFTSPMSCPGGRRRTATLHRMKSP